MFTTRRELIFKNMIAEAAPEVFFLKYCNIYRKTSVLEPIFNEVAGL